MPDIFINSKGQQSEDGLKPVKEELPWWLQTKGNQPPQKAEVTNVTIEDTKSPIKATKPQERERLPEGDELGDQEPPIEASESDEGERRPVVVPVIEDKTEASVTTDEVDEVVDDIPTIDPGEADALHTAAKVTAVGFHDAPISTKEPETVEAPELEEPITAVASTEEEIEEEIEEEEKKEYVAPTPPKKVISKKKVTRRNRK